MDKAEKLGRRMFISRLKLNKRTIAPRPGLTYLGITLPTGRCPVLMYHAPEGALYNDKKVVDLTYVKPGQRPGTASHKETEAPAGA
jgi:hypothetical protein